MSNEKKRTFCGNARTFGNYNSLSIFVNLDQVPGIIVTKSDKKGSLPPHLVENKKGELCLKLNAISTPMEKQEYGQTHSVSIDDFVKS